VTTSTVLSAARLGTATFSELVTPESLKSFAPTRNAPDTRRYSGPLSSDTSVSVSTDAPVPRLCTPMSRDLMVTLPPAGSSGRIIST